MGELLTEGTRFLPFTKVTPVAWSDRPCRVKGALDLTSAKVNGDVRLVGLYVGGELSLQAAEIGGNLLCRASAPRRTRLLDHAWLMGVRVRGSVDFTGTEVRCSITLENASIGGHVLFRRTRNYSFDFSCKVAGKIWLLNSDIASNVEFAGTEIGGDLRLDGARLGQNVTVNCRGSQRTRIKGDLLLRNAQIARTAEIRGACILGKMDLGGTTIGDSLILGFDLNDGPDRTIIRAEIRGGIQAKSVGIGRDAILMGLFASPGDDRDGGFQIRNHDVDFEGARINGRFSLHAPDVLLRDLLDWDDALTERVAIPEGVVEMLRYEARRAGTVIAGDLRLIRAQVGGSLILDAAQIGGDVNLRDTQVRANVECKPVHVIPPRPERGRVDRAHMATLVAHGDVILTGLNIAGDLNLREADIRGRLELHPEGEPANRDHVAQIGGALLLDGAKVSHVIIAGLSFDDVADARRNWIRAAWSRGDYLLLRSLFRGGHPDEDDESAPPAKHVVFERATIGQMEIVNPLPGVIDLSGLHVSTWKDRSNFYRDMLSRSYPFKKSSYRAVEKDLRNRGNDSEADEVYVMMRRRDRRYSKSFPRILSDWLLDMTVWYGTNALRPSLFMLLLFLVTARIFSDPGRVEYRVSPSSQKPVPTIVHPNAAEWNLSDALFLAVRLHVPIVSLGVGDDVQPSGNVWQAYGIVVVASSLVIWPLILASLSGLLRRRE